MSAFTPRILVIVNPVSGQGEIEEALDVITHHLNVSGVEYDLRKTAGEGDALRWAREAAGYERIIVAGGDGTVMEAMSGAIENANPVPLAQIPLGTASLLARAFAIPIDTGDAMEVALQTGVSTKMDVGYLPDRKRYFALVAGAGWDAEMIDDADREMKNKLGFFAYVVSGVKHFFDLKRSRITATIDGRKKKFHAHTLMVINVGKIEGSGIALGENVDPHDGTLNLAVVAMRGPLGIIRLVWRLLTKQFDGSSELRYFKVSQLKLDANPPMKLEIDGESIGETPFEVEVVPAAALLIVPLDYAESKKVEFNTLASYSGEESI